MKKMLAMLLVIAMLATVVVSCGSKDNSNTDTTTSTTTADEGAKVSDTATETTVPEETLDVTVGTYNRDFVIYQCGNWVASDFLAEEYTGEALNDAQYEMMETVSEMFGITISSIDEGKGSAAGGQGTGYKTIETMHMSGSQDYDFASIGCYDVCTLAYTGYLSDLTEVENIDLSKSWWDQKAVEQLNVGGRVYYATGDAMILDNECTYCILFNKTVVNQYNLEDPYELVKSGKWTYDKFIEMADAIDADLNGDGQYTQEDAYGVTVWLDSCAGMLHASGGAVAKFNEDGNIEVTLNSERNINVLTTWTLDNASNICYYIASDTNDAAHQPFTSDHCLFYTRYVRAGQWFRDTDLDFGYLPYPKWDESQEEYCNTMHAYGTSWLCIPSACADVSQSGAIMESLSYYGQKLLNPAYYEITLEGKTIRDEESSDMLDIIFETRFFDVGMFYQVGSYNSSLFAQFKAGTTNYTSVIRASEKVAQKQLDKITSSFEKIAG